MYKRLQQCLYAFVHAIDHFHCNFEYQWMHRTTLSPIAIAEERFDLERTCSYKRPGKDG